MCKTLTNCAGLQFCLHGVIMSGEFLVNVRFDHVVLRERGDTAQRAT